MKVFSAATAFCLASMAFATESSLDSRQGPTAVGTINASIAALVPALPQYEAAIGSAVTTIKQSTSVQAQVVIAAEGVIAANLDAIVSGLNASANAIAAATTKAAGGVTAAAAGLVQSDIDMLVKDIQIVENIIAGLNASLAATASLQPAVRATVQSEITALKNALAPFVDPVILLANAAVAVSTGVSVGGLAAASAGLQTVANNLYRSLGVSV